MQWINVEHFIDIHKVYKPPTYLYLTERELSFLAYNLIDEINISPMALKSPIIIFEYPY